MDAKALPDSRQCSAAGAFPASYCRQGTRAKTKNRTVVHLAVSDSPAPFFCITKLFYNLCLLKLDDALVALQPRNRHVADAETAAPTLSVLYNIGDVTLHDVYCGALFG